MNSMMTTSKLIMLRLFNITLGRIPFFSRLLKKILIRILIKKQKNKRYVASSRFFDWADLDDFTNKKARIVILTRNEPFYIPLYLSDILSKKHQNILKVYIDSKPSPHLSKIQLLRLCGMLNFVYLSFKYLFYKTCGLFNLRRNSKVFYSIISALKHYNIDFQSGFDVKSDNFKRELLNLRPDVLLSVANSQIIPSDILEIKGLVCLNTHGALLPEYRGILTAFWMILNEEQKGGVTIHKITEKIDGGTILNQAEFDITETDTIVSVYNKVAKYGSKIILKTIEQFESDELTEKENNYTRTIYSVPDSHHINMFLKKGRKFV